MQVPVRGSTIGQSHHDRDVRAELGSGRESREPMAGRKQNSVDPIWVQYYYSTSICTAQKESFSSPLHCLCSSYLASACIVRPGAIKHESRSGLARPHASPKP